MLRRKIDLYINNDFIYFWYCAKITLSQRHVKLLKSGQRIQHKHTGSKICASAPIDIKEAIIIIINVFYILFSQGK